ncbi:MAG: hypothetical protein ACREPF_07420 [Rhodanobacteraceae bacterium]
MHHERHPEGSSGTLPPRAPVDDEAGDIDIDTTAGALSGDSSDADDGNVRVIHVRLNGPADRIGEVLAGLDELPGVDNIVQLIMDAPVERDDSSTAESNDDNPSSFQEVELEVADPQAWDDARAFIEARAARADVVLEWLERF